MSAQFGALQQHLIDAMAQEGPLRRASGGWRLGAMPVSDCLVSELKRRDWVRIEGDSLVLTPAGQARCRDKAAAGGGANRLLAERSLPQDEDEVAAPTPTRGSGSGRRRPARSVTVNLAESPLGWLRARGLVDARQFEAGERLRGDWTIAGLGPRVTMRWEGGARSTGEAPDPTLAQIGAKRRCDAAFAAIGPGLRDVLWRTVCAGEGMETAERALGWPARTGRVVLTLALDRLADFYGLG